MAKLGDTPHIRLFIDKDGQLYIYDQISKEKQLISMRSNSDGSKLSRAPASDIEDAIWDFRYDHKESEKPVVVKTDKKTEKKRAPKKKAAEKPAAEKPAAEKPAEKSAA